AGDVPAAGTRGVANAGGAAGGRCSGADRVGANGAAQALSLILPHLEDPKCGGGREEISPAALIVSRSGSVIRPPGSPCLLTLRGHASARSRRCSSSPLRSHAPRRPR